MCGVTATAIMVDNRGTDKSPHGFVYFRGTRVGYLGGSGNQVDTHLVTPYLFQANWGPVETYHYVAAWKALAEGGLAGFDNPEAARIAVVDEEGTHRVVTVSVADLQARGYRALQESLARSRAKV